MNNTNGKNNFFNEFTIYAKYVNINGKLNLKQKNRFDKLLGSKESNMFLLLRILDAYAMFVSLSPGLN